MNRKGILFCLHSWTGLVTGIFIVVMSVSGSLLVFHEELDRLQYPTVYTVNEQPLLSVDSSYSILQKQYPKARISNVHLAETVRQPYIFSITDSSYQGGKASLQVFLHPQTGEILATRGGSSDARHNVMSWLSALHNSFHLQKKGEWLLGFLGVLFLLNIVSGTILYRKKIIPVLLFRKHLFTKKNIHQLIGVYALLFNLVIGITGVWMQRYVFKESFYAKQTDFTMSVKPSPPLYFHFDSSLLAAKTQYPEFTGYVVYFAQSASGKTAVYGSRSTNSLIHSRKFADVLFLDSTGAVAKTAFVDEIDKDSRYDIINSQVHFGKYGGLPVKIAYALLGLSGAILGCTGISQWLQRKKRQKQV